MMGPWVLIAISAVFGCAFHAACRNFALASLLSACLSILVFLTWATARDGHVDKFIGIACVVGFGVAAMVSIVVGIPFVLLRRKHRL